MNELISIRENKGKQVVSARELYLSLGYDSSNYSRWVKSNIIENPYSIEGEDWTPLVTNDEPINQNVNPTKDYAITIVMAKKIAMMSKTEIGNKIRDYFIEHIPRPERKVEASCKVCWKLFGVERMGER